MSSIYKTIVHIYTNLTRKIKISYTKRKRVAIWAERVIINWNKKANKKQTKRRI